MPRLANENWPGEPVCVFCAQKPRICLDYLPRPKQLNKLLIGFEAICAVSTEEIWNTTLCGQQSQPAQLTNKNSKKVKQYHFLQKKTTNHDFSRLEADNIHERDLPSRLRQTSDLFTHFLIRKKQTNRRSDSWAWGFARLLTYTKEKLTLNRKRPVQLRILPFAVKRDPKSLYS